MALWWRVTGLLFLIPVIAGLAMLTASVPLGLAMVVGFGALGAGFYAFGHFMTRLKGWTRGVAVVLAALSVLSSLFNGGALGVLIALGWNGAQIATLVGPRGSALFSPAYRLAIEGDGRKVRWWASPFFWAPLAAIPFYVAIALATAH